MTAPYFEAQRHPTLGIVVFTHDQAPGAWPNGTRMRKTGSEPGDSHQDGALATVVGSMGLYQGRYAYRYAYFVEWDDMPGLPIGIVSYRLERVEKEERDAQR